MIKENDTAQIPDGVVIPPEVIALGKAVRAKRAKTLAELPVYRDSANLLLAIAEVVKRSGAPLRKFYDEMTASAFEILNSIGMADSSRNPEQRVEYINCAISLVSTVRTAFKVLCKLGIVSKDFNNKQRALTKRIVAQLVGWRDYTRGEGAEPDVQPETREGK